MDSNSQAAPTKAEPRPEHAWLQKFIGEWTYECEMPMGPDKPPVKMSGSESVRAIGELWITGEGDLISEAGEKQTSLLTLGFDPGRGRFVGTWLASVMAYLWVYDGELGPDKSSLILDSEGPSLQGEGKLARYRDIHEFRSADHRILRSEALGDDGQWHSFMEMEYHRKR
jgi:hypothetical protein